MPAENSHEMISGLVDRVTFHNEDNGFSVLKVQVKGQKEPVTLVGRVAQITAGEHVVAEGVWNIDRTHGRQFKAEMIRATPPDSPEGIEKFLGSGLVKGIGPVYAKKLVGHFGRDVLKIIDEQSARLQEVEGIGPTRRKAIKESWQEAKSVREIMTFLMSHGVSTARAFRIHKTYGEEAMVKVQADPYCLARDIRGIGFKTADEIASHFGFDKNSPLRARAGVEHMLAEISGQGHCACPRDELTRQSAELLDIDRQIVEDAILHGLAEKRLILEVQHADDPLIYLSALHRAETELADDLRKLLSAPFPFEPIPEDKALDWVQKQIKIDLAPAQRDAVATALRSKVMVITGGPGVGKTTIVNAIIRIFKARKLKVKLAAPTGRAAKRLSETTGEHAMTLHRLLVFDPATGGFKHNRSSPLKGEVFIIDEASMLDLHLAYQVIRALPANAVLLLVGDVDQLPSVGPGSVLRDVIESGSVPVCRLTEIFRQAQNSAIVMNAHRVNRGEFPVSGSQAHPGDFYIVPAETPEEVWSKIRGLLKGALQNKFGIDPRRDAQLLTPMQRGGLGARALNTEIQTLLNPRGDFVERFGTTFRVGDRVMQTLNNYDKDVFNGDMGRVVSIDPMERELWVDMAGHKVSYSFNELDELVLSYAITIHKSQGSEYPCVILPLHTQHYMMLQRNLLYTAITRGKRLVILVGNNKAIAMAVNRADTRHRIGCLKNRLSH
ncbi:MAG: ATP-dependent RecD-like DNA helicase [Verrucomicrobia bacterium]|nr:ATP-dependent RecD-like DNA helicase [Verrucomicrobiota bacterium]MCH8527200.1 ATP-dependent RecD-like DNA helicase [Kiritimatiellia bacterium]